MNVVPLADSEVVVHETRRVCWCSEKYDITVRWCMNSDGDFLSCCTDGHEIDRQIEVREWFFMVQNTFHNGGTFDSWPEWSQDFIQIFRVSVSIELISSASSSISSYQSLFFEIVPSSSIVSHLPLVPHAY